MTNLADEKLHDSPRPSADGTNLPATIGSPVAMVLIVGLLGGAFGTATLYFLSGKLPHVGNHFEPALTCLIVGGLAGLMSTTGPRLGLARSLAIIAGIGILARVLSFQMEPLFGWTLPVGYDTDRFTHHRLLLRLSLHVSAVALLIQVQRRASVTWPASESSHM